MACPCNADFVLVAGDTLPILKAQLLQHDKSPIDLSTADSVVFNYRKKDTDPYIQIAATVTDAPFGRVEVVWGAGDTTTPGTYKARFKVTYPGPKVLSVPNQGHAILSIEAE